MQMEPAHTMIVLAALAGAVHVLAPDHWLPASVVAWQRGWSLSRSAAFAALTFLVHLVLGVVIYFSFDSILAEQEASRLFAFGMILVFSVMIVRMLRFSRLREVVRAGPNSSWGLFAVISLLGPCESVIPILIKARQLGIGYLIPSVSFLAGTMVVGMACVVAGRLLWNRPLWLPRGISWARSRSAILPAVAGLALGLTAILRV
jgi:hypothetical protein